MPLFRMIAEDEEMEEAEMEEAECRYHRLQLKQLLKREKVSNETRQHIKLLLRISDCAEARYFNLAARELLEKVDNELHQYDHLKTDQDCLDWDFLTSYPDAADSKQEAEDARADCWEEKMAVIDRKLVSKLRKRRQEKAWRNSLGYNIRHHGFKRDKMRLWANRSERRLEQQLAKQ